MFLFSALGYFQYSVQNWQKLQEFITAVDAAILGDTSRDTNWLCYSLQIVKSTVVNYHMASPGSLQQSNGVSKLEPSCTFTLYQGTQFCLYYTEKKCTTAWICGRQQLCYPSGYADQVCCSKDKAQLCQPFPRDLTSAMEGELNSLLRDELLPLYLLGFQH